MKQKIEKNGSRVNKKDVEYPEREKQLNVVERAIQKTIICSNCLNNPDVKLFIGSIHASGVGITLTSASDVVFLEFDWTPANHSQGEDRCHRIGQKDSVNAYYLALDNSIDIYISNMLIRKQNIIDQIVKDVEKMEEEKKSIFDSLLDTLEGGQ